MATDTELQRLVVQLEASFTKYERQWSKAMGVTDANVKKTQAQFNNMARVVSSGGSSAAAGLAPVGVQTANIAAQFQDIAVQLQAGQSPFTIALQQGTQLSQALGTGRGLRGTVAALGAAFGSLVSPVSLATIALITAGGFAVQYFATLLNDGKASEEELKKQEDLIRKVAERWGEAVPALKAYVAELDRAKEAAELGDAFDRAISDAFTNARTALATLNPQVTDLVTQLTLTNDEGVNAANSLQREFGALEKKVKDSTATSADFERVVALIAQISESYAIPALGSLQGVLDGLSNSFATASRNAQTLRQEMQSIQQIDAGDMARDRQAAAFKFTREQERQNALTTEQLALESAIASVKADAEREGVVLAETQLLRLAQQKLDAEERRAALKENSKSGAKAETEADREAAAVLELIAALEHEYDMLGLTAQQQEVANALRRAGSAATSEQRDEIEALVNKTYEERQQIEAMQDVYDQLGQAGKSAIMGIVDAMADGKVEAGELKNVLAGLVGQFGQFFLNQAFGGGGGGGNIFSTIFGGKRAAGGPVDAGKAYLVGEKGPEIIVPGRAGTVVPNHRLGGAGVSIGDVIINGNADAMTVQQLRQWSRFELPKLIRHHAGTTMPENG